MPQRFLTVLLCLLGFARFAVAGDGLQLLPSEITLHGETGLQQLTVVNLRGDLVSAALPMSELQFESGDPNVVVIEKGVAMAVGNGSTSITVIASDGREATGQVTVQSAGGVHQRVQFDAPVPPA